MIKINPGTKHSVPTKNEAVALAISQQQLPTKKDFGIGL